LMQCSPFGRTCQAATATDVAASEEGRGKREKES